MRLSHVTRWHTEDMLMTSAKHAIVMTSAKREMVQSKGSVM